MTYLLLTEFEGRTVNLYGPCFFPFYLWPKRVGHKSNGKNKGPSFTVRTEKTIKKIFVISLYLGIECHEREAISICLWHHWKHKGFTHSLSSMNDPMLPSRFCLRSGYILKFFLCCSPGGEVLPYMVPKGYSFWSFWS